MAGLPELAPGRFVLGLGASTKVLVEQWYGVPFERPLERTREVLLEVRRLLAGEKVGELRLGRPPAPPPPIWVAALGPKLLELARELADGVCFFMVGPRGLPALIEAAGGKESVCRVSVFLGAGPELDDFARRQIVAYAIVPYYARAMERQGFGEEVAAVNRLWSQGERRSAPGQISDAMLDELTLRGSAERVAAGLERYYEAGLTVPALNLWATGEEADGFLAELPKYVGLQ